MTRYLLDSGIASDFMNKRNGVSERAYSEATGGNRIGIAVPVLAELVHGIEKSANRDRNMKLLKATLPAWKIWPFDAAAAFQYGLLHATLSKMGRPMQVIDIMIASIALTMGKCTVVTKDSDLSAVPGLRVVNWAEME